MKKPTSIFLLFLTISCSVQQVQTQSTCVTDLEAIRDLIESQMVERNQYKISINNEILKKSSVRNLSMAELIPIDSFNLLRPLKVNSQNEINDLKKEFTKEDFDHMRCQLRNNTSKYWSEIINQKNLQLPNTNTKEWSYSFPLFTKNKKYALIYIEAFNFGEIRIFKREHQHWVYYANQFVFSSD